MENQKYCEYDDYEICNCVKLGDKAPDFDAVTTHGDINFMDYNNNSWVILSSHPADFTPVCTTEFVGFAEKQDEFDKRNVKLLGLSIDSVYSHIAWIREIEKHFEVKIKFPVIADLSMDVANLYGMIHPAISSVHAVRTVTIVDPEGIIRFMVTYPQSVGRNIDEIIRIIDAIQLIDKENIVTPANWNRGDNVIVPPPKTTEGAENRTHEEHDECKSWFLCKRKL